MMNVIAGMGGMMAYGDIHGMYGFQKLRLTRLISNFNTWDDGQVNGIGLWWASVDLIEKSERDSSSIFELYAWAIERAVTIKDLEISNKSKRKNR